MVLRRYEIACRRRARAPWDPGPRRLPLGVRLPAGVAADKWIATRPPWPVAASRSVSNSSPWLAPRPSLSFASLEVVRVHNVPVVSVPDPFEHVLVHVVSDRPHRAVGEHRVEPPRVGRAEPLVAVAGGGN